MGARHQIENRVGQMDFSFLGRARPIYALLVVTAFGIGGPPWAVFGWRTHQPQIPSG